MSESSGDSDERTTSMCAIYADLIETEIDKNNPDLEQVRELLGFIRKYCQTVAFEPGESPEHLEEFQYEPEGDD